MLTTYDYNANKIIDIFLVLGELKSNYQMLHFCIVRGLLFFLAEDINNSIIRVIEHREGRGVRNR